VPARRSRDLRPTQDSAAAARAAEERAAARAAEERAAAARAAEARAAEERAAVRAAEERAAAARAAEARAAEELAAARAAAGPHTTSLPFTPGPPTPAPDTDDPTPEEFLDRPTGRPATGYQPRAVRGRNPLAAAPAAAVAPPPARAPRTPDRDPGRRPPRDDEPTDVSAPSVAPARVAGPASGPVGGRAAARLQRQAAEAAARKGGRRGSPSSGAQPAVRARTDGSGQASRPPGPGHATRAAGDPATGTPRRAVQLLLATVVVALVVLGVWSFTSPRTHETSAESPADVTATASPGPPVEAAPSVEATPSAAAEPSQAPAPEATARAPITVLNATKVTGLAAAIGGRFADGGWEVNAPGAYSGTDIAVTTVFYTEGDAAQQQAAAELMAEFPDIVGGPAPRFFDIMGLDDPGLVVVATGDWQP
jgi:LytR cell envelope-related transcriptional attenuator